MSDYATASDCRVLDRMDSADVGCGKYGSAVSPIRGMAFVEG